MKKFKILPIGISDYKHLIEGDYYYVDKTLFIEEFKRTSGQILLITRPRRFGKTLNLSMLKYFFEISQTSNEHLFYGTAIWQKSEYHKFQGQYPVIFLTFRAIKSMDWQTAYGDFVELIVEEFKRHASDLLPTLAKQDAEDYNAILSRTASKSLYTKSLFFLTRLLRTYHKKNVIVLLDEYDGPIQAAYHYGYYEQLIEFIRSLLTTTFKDNSYLERGVLTGILRAAKEGIFSGLNNLRVFSVLEKKFADKFGFTHNEVEQFLTDYELLQYQKDIKIWYDGYKCGAAEHIYNPWSVIECIDNDGQLLPYWVNTSDNKLVKKLIARADETIKSEFGRVLSGRSIEKEIKDVVIIPDIENDSNVLWGLLLSAGFITFSEYNIIDGKKWYTLMLPNKEMAVLFEDLIEESLAAVKYSYLQNALVTRENMYGIT